VALAHGRLVEMGSEFVEAINSIAGERCSPHPHVFSDRLIRPGDQAYLDIIHVYNGYRTCYYRTFVVGRATQALRDAFKQSREWMDAAIELVKPGTTTDQIAKVWPRAEEFGFDAAMLIRNALWRPPFVMYYLSFLLPRARRLLAEHGFDVEVHAAICPEYPRFDLVVGTRPSCG